MAARGARSRKVLDKDIEKKEKKQAAKEYVSSFSRAQSPSSGWSYHARSPTAQGMRTSSAVQTVIPHRSRPASVHSSSTGWSNSDGRAPSILSGRSKLSTIASSTSTEKYKAKTKETIAPRGRGGGVPPKIASTGPATTHTYGKNVEKQFRPDSAATQLTGRDKAWAGSKIWHGDGIPPSQYYGFEKDKDLWMATGDCLIFFSEETHHEEDPRPMLRVHVKVLEQARSVFMSNLLKYGEIMQDTDVVRPPSRSGTASVVSSTTHSSSGWPLTQANLGHLSVLSDDSETTAWDPTDKFGSRRPGTAPPTPNITPGSQAWYQRVVQPATSEIGGPPLSSGASESASAVDREPDPIDVTHEIWFRAPSHIDAPEIQRRHHVATRNYLALLYGLPIVGNNFFQMLDDLKNIMDTYYELNEPSQRWNSVQVIIQYILRRKLDDLRGDMKATLGFLQWCEQQEVRWDEGYLEAFVHSVGMMTPAVFDSKNFRDLSRVTRHNLENAYNAMQLRILEAEERLNSFYFQEMWQMDNVTANSPVWKAFNDFRSFLVHFYAMEYSTWPLPPNSSGRWLNREIVQRLQADFGAMYDYLVDRDVSWDSSEERHTRKWEIVSTRARSAPLEVDRPGLPLTDMLVGFDNQNRYQHIPHPFPLLPQSSAALKQKPDKKSFFGSFKKTKPVLQRDPKEHFQMSLAFNGATNVNKLGTSFQENKLIDELNRYEKSLPLPSVDPASARLGRWLLLYGILQVLSTISVDVSGLKYTTGIKYFLSSTLEGCPPWQPQGQPAPQNMVEASQARSWCWTRPTEWSGHTGVGSHASLLNPLLRPGIGSSMGSYELDSDAEAQDMVSELDGRSVGQLNRMGTIARDRKTPSVTSLGNGYGNGTVGGVMDNSVNREERGGSNMIPRVPERSPRRALTQMSEMEMAEEYFGNGRA